MEKKKSKTKKVLLGCFTIFIIFLLLFVGSLLYVMSSIFDDKPAHTVIKTPEIGPLQSATEKLLKTLGGESLMNGDVGSSTNLEDISIEDLGLGNLDSGSIDLNNIENLDLGKLLKKVDLGKVMGALAKPGKLTLTKAEVNALIGTAFTADKVGDFQDPDQPRVYDAWFNNGRFTLKITFDSKLITPFGSYCNIEVVLVPQVIDHHLKLDLFSAKAGTISFPVSYLKGTIDQTLLNYEQSDDGKQLLQLIDSLKVDEEKIVLEYNFQELSLFLLEKQEDLQILNNSSDTSAEEILNLFQ